MARTRPLTAPQLVTRYERWLGRSADPDALDNVRLLLDVRATYLADDPVCWYPGDICELLLRICPRKVDADPRLLATGPADLRHFLGFLEASGELDGARLGQLLAELDDAAPRFAAAMADRRSWGMAKTAFDGMSEDGVDVTDERAVQAWVDERNAGLAQPSERPGLVLPPVVLAEPDELRRRAAQAPLVQRVGALVAYLGPTGRAVTQTGALKVIDAKALAADCGDEERLLRPAAWMGGINRMADLQGVTEAHSLAVGAGLVDIAAGRARRQPAKPGVADELARAAALATAALEAGVFLAGDRDGFVVAWALQAVEESLAVLLAHLYVTAEPVPVEVLHQLVRIQLPGYVGDDVPMFVSGYLSRVLRRFDRLGMIEQLGWQVPPDRQQIFGDSAVPEPTSVVITPLGTWWAQALFTKLGLRAPLAGELATAGAGELCDGIRAYDEAAIEAEIAAWVAARGDDAACAQLAGLLGSEQLEHRQLALALLDRFDGAPSTVREMLTDERSRPYARFWLESRGHEVDAVHMQPGDLPLLFVEGAVLLVDVPELVPVELADLGSVEEQAALVRELWRVPSPHVRPVLEAIEAEAAPVVRKAARRALHSLRSAQGARNG